MCGEHGGEVVVEDLVFVVVDDGILGVVVERGEAVAEDDGDVADLADVVEAVAVILFRCGAVGLEVGEERFVEELDGDDNVLVGGNSVFGGHLGDVVVGEAGGVLMRWPELSNPF